MSIVIYDKDPNVDPVVLDDDLIYLKPDNPELMRIIYHYAKVNHYWPYNKRSPKAEAVLMKNAQYAMFYAKNVLRHRWPEAEQYIIKKPRHAVTYARDIIKGRWPEAEPYIMKSAEACRFYAIDVIHGRWPEAEHVIKKGKVQTYFYLNYLKQLEIIFDECNDIDSICKHLRRMYQSGE